MFFFKGTGLEGITINAADSISSSGGGTWVCPWKVRPPNPVHFLAYSPDGTLFATAGANDRLVRIWYENQQSKSLKQIKKYESESIVEAETIETNIHFCSVVAWTRAGESAVDAENQ